MVVMIFWFKGRFILRRTRRVSQDIWKTESVETSLFTQNTSVVQTRE